ncbi:MAG TPA: TolC family protein [Usitatibacter sp.]|nr:TolC family protein [Usitatibacter sp.]
MVNALADARTCYVLRCSHVGIALVGSLLLWATAGIAGTRLTLEQAVAITLERNPDLRAAAAQRPVIEAQLREANAPLWHNPELSAEARDRRSTSADLGSARNRDGAVGIAETFEVAGQMRHRRAAARTSLEAFDSEHATRSAALRLEVERRFVAVLVAQERVAMEADLRWSFETAAGAVGKRVRAGEDSRLDGNLARVELERAMSQAAAQQDVLIQARQSLATLLQLPPGSLPEAEGTIDPAVAPDDAAELARQLHERPAFSALRLREEEARNRLELERAFRTPDVTVGVSYGREKTFDARDNIATLSVSVPLPFFRRNETGISRAAAELARAQIARQAAERDMEAQLAARLERLRVAAKRVARLREAALPALEENRVLAARAAEAGEIGLLQVIVVNRQLLEGERELLDARAEWRNAAIALEAAAQGLPAEAVRTPRADGAPRNEKD